MKIFQGVDQHGLVPTAQGLQIGAKILFYQFIRLLQQIMLDLKLADVALQANRFLQARTAAGQASQIDTELDAVLVT